MSFLNFQPQNDIDRGREALKYFHNQMCTYDTYHETLDSVIGIVAPKSPNIFLDSLGFAISSIDMRSGQVQDAMETLASHTGGKIPDQHSFFQALSDRVSQPTFLDYVDASPSIALDTAKTAVEGAAAVGNAVIDTGKSLLTIGPLLIVGAVVFLVVMKTKKLAA